MEAIFSKHQRALLPWYTALYKEKIVLTMGSFFRLLAGFLSYVSTLKMDVVLSSETSVDI
jgi:hypothetical protein